MAWQMRWKWIERATLAKLRNDATLVIPHVELERFLAATGHAPRIVDVPGRRASDAT